MKQRLRFTLILTLGLTGCIETHVGSPTEPEFTVPGSGILVTESRTVSGFDSILLSVPGELILEQTGSESLTITAEDNLIDDLTSVVAGGRLVLGTRSGVSIAPRRPILYRLTVRTIGDLVVSGAARVDASGIQGDRFAFTLSGAGEVNISGTVTRQSLTLSGAGNYNAANLRCRVASIALSGAGRATLRASQRIEGVISGAGILEYYGDPEIAVIVSGSGSIHQVGG
jgi:hypothetical protein